jgi:broad specificity phosphatase PhoE
MGALTDISKRHPDQSVLVVIHGGLIRATLIGLDYVKAHQLKTGAFRNGGHIRLKFDGQVFSVEHVDGLTTHEGAE